MLWAFVKGKNVFSGNVTSIFDTKRRFRCSIFWWI